MLVRIDAANYGFQAKFHNKGSYFSIALYSALQKTPDRFLVDILGEIQKRLEDQGKQLIQFTFNNDTGYIKFYPKEKSHDEVVVEEEKKSAPKDVELIMGVGSRAGADRNDSNENRKNVEDGVQIIAKGDNSKAVDDRVTSISDLIGGDVAEDFTEIKFKNE